MRKKENKEWMERAESVLQSTEWNCPLFKNKCPLFTDEGKTTIYDRYTGQIAALGVSILMIGLKPTLAIYYQDAPKKEKDKVYRRALLEVIARMLGCESAESLVRYLLKGKEEFSDEEKEKLEQDEKKLKTDILNCSIALKQVIRTYKLEKDGEDK